MYVFLALFSSSWGEGGVGRWGGGGGGGGEGGNTAQLDAWVYIEGSGPEQYIYLNYITCLRYTILARNPQYRVHMYMCCFVISCSQSAFWISSAQLSMFYKEKCYINDRFTIIIPIRMPYQNSNIRADWSTASQPWLIGNCVCGLMLLQRRPPSESKPGCCLLVLKDLYGSLQFCTGSSQS